MNYLLKEKRLLSIFNTIDTMNTAELQQLLFRIEARKTVLATLNQILEQPSPLPELKTRKERF